MPYLEIAVTKPKSDALSGQIASSLVKHTSEILGKNPDVTSVNVKYVLPDEWFIGGKAVSKTGLTTFNLEILVTEGTNTKEEKAEYLRQVFADMREILGELTPACYIFINEIKGDSWGFEGKTQEFRYIKGKLL